MLGVRIKIIGNGFLIGVKCECGNERMTDETSRAVKYSHCVELGGKDVTLGCFECPKRYLLRPQQNHIHVETIPA